MANPLPAIEDAASNVANGDRIKSTPSMPCYLLELPWEVRNRILRYLLYSDELLRLLKSGVDDDENESEEGTNDLNQNEGHYKNYAFSPQVMRACRQLCDEGKLVLNSNTIGIDLCKHVTDGWQWAIAGHRQEEYNFYEMWLGEKVNKMFHEADKFYIFMDLRETVEDLYIDDLCNSPAAHLCKCLVEKQNLKQCRIDVAVKQSADVEAYFYRKMGGDSLAIFHMLRCKEFSISGCDEKLALRLKGRILADEPVRNLWAMQDALENPVWRLAEFADEADVLDCGDPCTLLTEAVVWGDVHEFLSLRSSVLKAIDNYQAKKRRELLELDLACKSSAEEEKKLGYRFD